MDKKVIAGIFVLILIFGGGIFFLNQSRKAAQPGTATIQPVIQGGTQQVPPVDQTNQATKVSPTAFPTIPPEMIPKGQDTITLTSTGFDPQAITVKVSTQVIWTNKSGADAAIASADHPTHQIYPPLNLGQFSNGQILTLVFGTPGVYKYHDHLHPERTGTVIVVE